jgi:hypothetical protein
MNDDANANSTKTARYTAAPENGSYLYGIVTVVSIAGAP